MKNDMVSIYMKQVEAIPLLTAAQEKELLLKASEGDKLAIDKILTANLRFVVKIANQFKNRGVEFEDLICEGNLALIRAIKKIDLSKDVKFITYAQFWIRQYMKAAIYSCGRSVSIPQNHPEQLKNQNFKALSLDKPMDCDNSESLSLVDSIYDNKALTPQEICEKTVCKEDLMQALNTLKPREKFVLEHHFGLNGLKPEGLREIGQQINLSRETIRIIENKAIEKLYNNKILKEIAA